MPIVLLWGLAAVMSGYGLKLAGDAVEDAGKGIGDLMLAGAVLGGVYLLAKDRGLV